VRGSAYDAFIEEYLKVASSLFPGALLHFEDFGPDNARRILVTRRDRYRIFNDDIQGTGAITLAAVLSAVKVTGIPLRDQKLVVFGAGTAGVGIADQLRDAMIRDGAPPEQATAQIWLVDKQGLLADDMSGLRDFQKPYARKAAEIPASDALSLLDTIRHAAPTILLGTSTAHGAFTREVVEAMSAATDRPVILPISNPTSRIEAMPADIITWSKGKALVATGIPLPPVDYDGITYHIGQANNALVYPGLGLGTIVAGASRVTPAMLLAADPARHCCRPWRTCAPPPRPPRSPSPARPSPTVSPPGSPATWSRRYRTPCGSRTTRTERNNDEYPERERGFARCRTADP
jgi:malate dehydrogenase (oxaloacetate-decarboxylating)